MNGLARRVYAALLYLYPANFRREYANELMLLFADMHRDAAAQGTRATLSLWLIVLLDLASTATRERIRTMSNSRTAAAISLILCLPFMFLAVTASLNYEPPFVAALDKFMISEDGYSPTMLGRIVMLVMLFSLPAAFVINLLPMLSRKESGREAPFKPTRTHVIIGMLILLLVLVAVSDMPLNELEPFVERLGSASILGQIAFLLGLLALPAAFLLNRVPRFSGTGSERALAFQPTSINLIIGAAILLIILMILSAFALEMTACSIGVPNCD